MTRFSGRLLAFFAVAMLVGGAGVQAAIIGSATLIKDPGSGVPFSSPDASLGAPWVSYLLSLDATDGDSIQAVEASISGQLHQRWTDPDAGGAYVPSGNSTNQANADSHFVASTAQPPGGLGMLFANGPIEDNPGSGSPLSGLNDDSTLRGVGTSMSATFGPPGAALTHFNVAYIVIPFGSEPTLNIQVKALNPSGEVAGLLDVGGFFPVITVDAPIVSPLALENFTFEGVVGGTVELDPTSEPADSWSANATFMGYAANYGGDGDGAYVPALAPDWDPITQAFSWNTSGSKRGDYMWKVTASNAGGDGTGLITVAQHTIPEPASIALLGLALIGFAGFRRK